MATRSASRELVGRVLAGLVLGALVWLAAPGAALAHWCSNIWVSPSRILIKPERSTVYLGSAPTKLRVYLQNNFPYTLFAVQLRGNAPGYTVQVSPAKHDVQPGQNVSYLLTISRQSGSGDVPVSTLNLQIKFRPGEFPFDWIGDSTQPEGTMIDDNPSQATLIQSSRYSMIQQWASLSAATLARRYPTAVLGQTAPFFGRTGLQQLIHWFGYRFCYNSGGVWRCGSKDCPGACPEGNAWSSIEQFPQNAMRAGVEVAAMHAQAKLGSQLAPARNAAVNALSGGSSQHRCLAALVGAYLWKGAANTKPFTTALSGAPSSCQTAARRLLSGGAASTCSGLSSWEEEGVCAAAEGLSGNDAPVRSILLKKAGDGWDPLGGDYKSLFYAYMLYIVSAHRQAKVGRISFFPDAGAPLFAPDGLPPTPDRGADTGGADDQGSPGSEGSLPGSDKGPTPGAEGAIPGGDGPTSGGDEGGCSCTTGGAPGSAAGLLLALLGLATLRRRRRGPRS